MGFHQKEMKKEMKADKDAGACVCYLETGGCGGYLEVVASWARCDLGLLLLP